MLKKATILISSKLFILILSIALLAGLLLYQYKSYTLNGKVGFPTDEPWLGVTWTKNFIAKVKASYQDDSIERPTSHLWAILLALGIPLRNWMPIWGHFLGTVFLALAILYAYKLAFDILSGNRLLAFVCALLLCLEWRLLWSALSGLELTLFLFLFLFALYTYLHQPTNPLKATVATGLLTLVRPEGIFLFVAIIAHQVYLHIKSRQAHLRQTGILIAVFSAFLTFNLILNLVTMGQPFPGFSAEDAKSNDNYLLTAFLFCSQYHFVFLFPFFLLFLLAVAFRIDRRDNFIPIVWLLLHLGAPVLFPSIFHDSSYLVPIIPILIIYSIYAVNESFTTYGLKKVTFLLVTYCLLVVVFRLPRFYIKGYYIWALLPMAFMYMAHLLVYLSSDEKWKQKLNLMARYIKISLITAAVVLFVFHAHRNALSYAQKVKHTNIRHERLAYSPAPTANEITILYTGNTKSYLEPCGCCSNQKGGVARRGTVVECLKAEEISPLIVDAGDFFDGDAMNLLDKIRNKLYLNVMETIGYDAVCIGAAELNFGLPFLRQTIAESKIPFLSANLTYQDGTLLSRAYYIKQLQRYKVAIVGVSNFPKGQQKELTWVQYLDPVVALQQHIPQAKQNADVILLLSNLDKNDNKKIARKIQGIDVIISSQEGQLEQIGQTIIVYSKVMGKSLGKLVISLNTKGQILRHQNRQIDLKENIPDHLQIRQLLTNFYHKVAKDSALQLAKKRLFANEALEQDATNGYLGAKNCQSCHQKEYKQWETTPHAFAFWSLVFKERHFYPDCVICHTTGFGYETGFNLNGSNEHLKGVQCETCHGPGKKHASKPKENNIRKKVTIQHCVQCHKDEHSANFMQAFSTLIPKVDHTVKVEKNP